MRDLQDRLSELARGPNLADIASILDEAELEVISCVHAVQCGRGFMPADSP